MQGRGLTQPPGPSSPTFHWPVGPESGQQTGPLSAASPSLRRHEKGSFQGTDSAHWSNRGATGSHSSAVAGSACAPAGEEGGWRDFAGTPSMCTKSCPFPGDSVNRAPGQLPKVQLGDAWPAAFTGKRPRARGPGCDRLTPSSSGPHRLEEGRGALRARRGHRTSRRAARAGRDLRPRGSYLGRGPAEAAATVSVRSGAQTGGPSAHGQVRSLRCGQSGSWPEQPVQPCLWPHRR